MYIFMLASTVFGAERCACVHIVRQLVNLINLQPTFSLQDSPDRLNTGNIKSKVYVD